MHIDFWVASTTLRIEKHVLLFSCFHVCYCDGLPLLLSANRVAPCLDPRTHVLYLREGSFESPRGNLIPSTPYAYSAQYLLYFFFFFCFFFLFLFYPVFECWLFGSSSNFLYLLSNYLLSISLSFSSTLWETSSILSLDFSL